MKTTLAIIVLGASVLMTSGANAYRSNANGNQAYPNPDRETYVNRVVLLLENEPQAQAGNQALNARRVSVPLS